MNSLPHIDVSMIQIHVGPHTHTHRSSRTHMSTHWKMWVENGFSTMNFDCCVTIETKYDSKQWPEWLMALNFWLIFFCVYYIKLVGGSEHEHGCRTRFRQRFRRRGTRSHTLTIVVANMHCKFRVHLSNNIQFIIAICTNYWITVYAKIHEAKVRRGWNKWPPRIRSSGNLLRCVCKWVRCAWGIEINNKEMGAYMWGARPSNTSAGP